MQSRDSNRGKNKPTGPSRVRVPRSPYTRDRRHGFYGRLRRTTRRYLVHLIGTTRRLLVRLRRANRSPQRHHSRRGPLRRDRSLHEQLYRRRPYRLTTTRRRGRSRRNTSRRERLRKNPCPLPSTLQLTNSIILKNVSTRKKASNLRQRRNRHSSTTNNDMNHRNNLTRRVSDTLYRRVTRVIRNELRHGKGNRRHSLPRRLSVRPRILPPRPRRKVFTRRRRHHRRHQRNLHRYHNPNEPYRSPTRRDRGRRIRTGVTRGKSSRTMRHYLTIPRTPRYAKGRVVRRKTSRNSRASLRVNDNFLRKTLQNPRPP